MLRLEWVKRRIAVSKIMLFVALGLLIYSPFLLIQNKDADANFLAMCAYLLLGVGVVIRMVTYLLKKGSGKRKWIIEWL